MKYVLVNDTTSREVAICASVNTLVEAARGLKRWSIWTADESRGDFEQTCVSQSPRQVA